MSRAPVILICWAAVRVAGGCATGEPLDPVAGTAGSSGTSGAAGTSASAGSTGVGAATMPGSAGTSGAAGSVGSAGTTGVAGTGVAGVTGSAGTSGSAGTTGIAGSGGGSVGSAGTAGAAGGRGGTGGGSAGAGGRGGAPGGAGIGGPSLCTPGKYLFCEDFEATAVGAVPTGWTKSGDATVQTDQAARGTHALKLGAAANGARRIVADAARLGSGHWGRIYYRVQQPVPTAFVHSTMVAFQGVGPSGGSGEFRVVDTVKNADTSTAVGSHQFLYNIQYSGNEVGRGSAYNYRFDGNWHCAEWHIDNPSQAFQYYFDGTQVSLSGSAAFDVPPAFSQVRVGWNNYQSAPPGFVAWIDEVAMDTNRIGCGN